MKRSSFLKVLVAIPIVGAFIKKEAPAPTHNSLSGLPASGGGGFIYTAWADDEKGRGYSNGWRHDKKYFACRVSESPIRKVTAKTFDGLWVKSGPGNRSLYQSSCTG